MNNEQRGSPYCTIELPVLAAAAIKAYHIEASAELAAWLKYAPLDYVQITNHDDVDLKLTLDQGEWFLIPSGAIETFKNKPWRRLDIENLDAAASTTLGKVIIVVKKMAGGS